MPTTDTSAWEIPPSTEHPKPTGWEKWMMVGQDVASIAGIQVGNAHLRMSGHESLWGNRNSNESVWFSSQWMSHTSQKFFEDRMESFNGMVLLDYGAYASLVAGYLARSPQVTEYEPTEAPSGEPDEVYVTPPLDDYGTMHVKWKDLGELEVPSYSFDDE